MKLVGVISAAVLSLTLGVAAPAYAQQEQHDQQEEDKAKPAHDEKKAQPEKPARQEDRNAKPEEKNARQEKNPRPEEKNVQQHPEQMRQAKPAEPAQRGAVNGGGRIPDDRYRTNFGQDHRFRVNESDYRNRRFQYGGYWFGFVGVWPSDWLYTQDVYVVDIGGVYYLCNPMYPGVNIEIDLTQ
jgi:hypothetical protein